MTTLSTKTRTPQVHPSRNDDADEVAQLAAAACFAWRSNAIDRDGNEHYDVDEDAGWVKTSDEVEVNYSAIEGVGNEVGMAPTMTATLEAHTLTGGVAEIEVELRMVGFSRGNDCPVATYWVKHWF